jgi:hypothetical protein
MSNNRHYYPHLDDPDPPLPPMSPEESRRHNALERLRRDRALREAFEARATDKCGTHRCDPKDSNVLCSCRAWAERTAQGAKR